MQENYLRDYNFLQWGSFTTESNDSLKHFKDKFKKWNYDYFLPAEVWENVFQNKDLDYEQLSKYVLDRCSPKVENWIELWHYSDKEDNQIEMIITDVRNDLNDEQFTDPVTILHIFSTFLAMQEDGFIVDKTREEIVNDAEMYIKKIASKFVYNTELTDLRRLLNFNGSGFGIYGASTNEVQNIAEKIVEAIRKKGIEFRKRKYFELLDMLKADSSEFVLWASSNAHMDIFSFQDPNLFWKKFISLPVQPFNIIGHWFDSSIIPEQLLNHQETQVEFWSFILNKAKEFVNENTSKSIQKSKCLYLKKYFIKNVETLLSKESKK